MAFGVTSAGFVKKTLSDLLDELAVALREALGQPGLNTGSDSAIGQILGVFGERLAELWELGESLDGALDLDTASGEALDNLALIVGRARLPASNASTTLTVNLNAGVTLPSGQIVSADGAPTIRFVTTASATNSGGSPADVSVTASCETTGTVQLLADTLTVIETPYSGWNTVTNDAAVDSGRARETDTEFRLRIAESRNNSGAGTVDAIRADVAAVSTIRQVSVINNPTASTVDGVAAHSFEVVVVGDDTTDEDNAIAQAIWDNRPAGISETGTNDTGVAIDAIDIERTMNFTRATEKRVVIEVDIVIDDTFSLSDGDDDIAAALDAYLATFKIGDDVKISKLYGSVFSVAGVADIDEIRLAFYPSSPTAANLTVGVREIATLDVADVTVTHV